MNKLIRTNNPGLRFLIDFWSKYCKLEPWHSEWARTRIRVPTGLHKGDMLYCEGERKKNIYLVAKGLLARVRYKGNKRYILSVALPGMALMTTDHLYSGTPSDGDIVVLRPNTVVVCIPYKAIWEMKDIEPSIDTLIDVLGNKKKKLITVLHRIGHLDSAFERCIQLSKKRPDVFGILTQQEIADIVHVSKTTVQSVTYFMAKGKKR